MTSSKLISIMNVVVLIMCLVLPVASLLYLSVGTTYFIGMFLMIMILQRKDRPAKVNYCYVLGVFTAITISSLIHLQAIQAATSILNNIAVVGIFAAKMAFGFWVIQFIDKKLMKPSVKGE